MQRSTAGNDSALPAPSNFSTEGNYGLTSLKGLSAEKIVVDVLSWELLSEDATTMRVAVHATILFEEGSAAALEAATDLVKRLKSNTQLSIIFPPDFYQKVTIVGLKLVIMKPQQ